MVDYSSGSAEVYDIHTDHLGRPQKMTDQSANLVWDGVFDPFGVPSGITGSVTMLLGFPGQYWDSETQLAQNWHRDYDPGIGRYVESDPLGLWGGVNTYSYVRANPMRSVDPLGFCDQSDPCVPLGADGPGWVFSIGVSYGAGVGITITSAGEIYVNNSASLVPGPYASALYANSMSGLASGLSGQVGYGYGIGGSGNSSAEGITTPDASVGYGSNFSKGLCELLNGASNEIVNMFTGPGSALDFWSSL
jgi:RHS repeat-associated protein